MTHERAQETMLLRQGTPEISCHCDGYHYPHRPHSPLCESNAASQDRRNEVLYGRA